MKLFKLTLDFTFKAVFGKNEDLLLALLNSFPQFEGDKKIHWLKVLNPELPKESNDEKLSILDIKARDIKGNLFLIEMQAYEQEFFEKRALYYTAKAYTKNLKKGSEYDELKKVYSFNFLNHSIFKNKKKYISTFKLLDVEDKSCLTEDLEINIIELPKFFKEIGKLKSDLEYWLYTIKQSDKLGDSEMKVLEKKPTVKKALSELKTISLDKQNRELYESKMKAIMDFNSNMNAKYKKGIEKGKLETGLKLIDNGMPLEKVCEITGLSKKQILDYKKSLEGKNTTQTR